MAVTRALLFAAAVLCFLAAVAESNDVTTIGTCRSGDRQLMVRTVQKSSSWLQVRHQLVSYPPAGEPGRLISCIKLQPLKTRNIGSAALQNGGPGHTQADVMVKSDRSHGVAWTITIFGP